MFPDALTDREHRTRALRRDSAVLAVPQVAEARASALSLTLSGYPQASLDGRPLHFARRSSLGLLAYLAHTGRPQTRARLAALLDETPAEGLATLRRSLADLKSLLGSHLCVDDQTVALAPTLQVETDVAALEAALREVDCHPSITLTALQAALAQCRGEFLEGFSLRTAYAFEEWQLLERERLHGLLVLATEQLSAACWRAGRLDEALAGARRLLALEPWHEGAHRAMMLLLLQRDQRAEALSHYAACCRTLDEELAAEPAPATEAIYARVLAAAPAPHNLPPEPTPFVGRAPELATLAGWLDDAACRVVAVTGAGGGGKTRLALRAAARYVAAEPGFAWLRFPHGVRLVALDALPADRHGPTVVSAGRIFGAIAGALGLPGTYDADQVLAALRDQTLLLILDNAEHLAGVDRVVEQLLAEAPGVTMLLTTRGAAPAARHVLELGLLPLPASAAELEQAEASALFLQRARQARLTFAPDAAERAAIARICAATGGLPLALVQAAQLVRSMSCEAIADLLINNPLDLGGPLRNLPLRHHSLRANIAYVWELLDPAQQRAVRRLAGPTRERAVGASPLDGSEAFAALATVGLLDVRGEGAPAPLALLHPFLAEQPAGAR